MIHRRLAAFATAAALGGALTLTGCVAGADAPADQGGASAPADPGQTAPGDDMTQSPDGSGGASAPADGPRDSGGSTDSAGVSMHDAGTIAVERYGGTVRSVEDDDYRGTPAWEVEVRDSDQGRIEVKVDKATGAILHMEHDG